MIDNSPGMWTEIREVERQINQNFANIIDNAGIDYQVAIVSGYGPPYNRDGSVNTVELNFGVQVPDGQMADRSRIRLHH